ncbi:MAG: tol-pal system protein YbgF [Nitrospirae bacterium]|nr:tol-pal system protein YbgF [Nitrospirota bacterium]
MRPVIICLLIFICGCATSSDIEMLKADINQLKKDSFEAGKETSGLRTGLAELKENTAGVVKEDSFNAIRESAMSLHSEISGISKDLQTLTGRFDENKYSLDKSLKDISSEIDLLRLQITSLETQVKDLQGRLSDAKAKNKPDAKKEKKAEPEEAKTSEIKDPAKLYEAAYNDFKDKKYKEAREKFESFLKEFPNDKLAGNAQFWIGETYYAEEDYAGAIVEYDALLKNHPESEKAPVALLKQGYSFTEMGDKKAAKGIMEQLIEKYPKSKEASLAKKKLEEIRKKSK